MVQGEINRGRHTENPAGHHSIRTNQCPPPPEITGTATWFTADNYLHNDFTDQSRTRSLAFLHAEWIPMLANCTSSSVPLSQVVSGCPRGLLQSLCGRSNALAAQCWSCLESEWATWPKKRGHLVLVILETGGQPVVSPTEALVTCLVYRIRRIFRRDHVSKASNRRARGFAIVHACDPYTNTRRS